MQDDDRSAQEPMLVSMRTMDIVLALLFLLASGVVLYDSIRLGIGWLEGEGPASGYFPFYIGLIMAVSSMVNLVRAVLRMELGDDGIFVSAPAFGRVLTVLIPAVFYVALIGGLSFFGWTVVIPQEVASLVGMQGPIELAVGIPRLGIYVASAIFIFGFMSFIGREHILKSASVAIITPVALFLLFEKWFLVPLPKGPLEAWLGY